MPRGFRWVTRIRTGVVIASGNQVCSDLLVPYTTIVDNLKGYTVTRILLKLFIVPDTANQQTVTSWGIAVINADAAAASAFPDADIEGDNVRWLMRDMALNRMTDLNDKSQIVEKSYDLRAQALFRSDQDELHLIMDNSSGGGVFHSFIARVLLRMP